MATKTKPIFSVIIPVSVLSQTLLTETLPHLNTQDEHRFECIVLPNAHSSLDRILQKTYPWLRIIPTYRIQKPAAKRNSGVKKAKGRIIAFLEDDAYPDAHWLTHAGQIISRNGIGAVGGPGILPDNAQPIEQIIDIILRSPIGSGGYGYRFIKKRAQFVDDYPAMNFFMQKKIFLAIGGFQTNFWPGEDSKLCQSLIDKKLFIYYSPRIVVYHHRRGTIGGFLRQHMRYGYHRGLFFGHGDANSRKIGYAIPSIFFGWVTISAIGVLVSKQYVLYPYMLLVLLVSIYAYCAALAVQIVFGIKQKISLISSIVSAVLMVALHITYASAFFWGVVHATKRTIFR